MCWMQISSSPEREKILFPDPAISLPSFRVTLMRVLLSSYPQREGETEREREREREEPLSWAAGIDIHMRRKKERVKKWCERESLSFSGEKGREKNSSKVVT